MAALFTLLNGRFIPPSDPAFSLTDKTIIITGSNTGLGYEAALRCVDLGASRIILAVRRPEAGEKAKQSIRSSIPSSSCQIDVFKVDMADYDSVRSFVARVKSEVGHVHGAILNAAIMPSKYSASKYGYESSMQINALGTAFLAVLLLDVLQSSGTGDWQPSMVLVSSTLYARVKPDLVARWRVQSKKSTSSRSLLDVCNEESKRGMTGLELYGLSKLWLMVVLQHLAKANSAVKITAVSPGPCRTGLGRNCSFVARLFMVVFGLLFFRSAKKGSRILVSGLRNGGHGGLFRDDADAELAPVLQDEYFEREAWDAMVQAISKDVPSFEDDVNAIDLQPR